MALPRANVEELDLDNVNGLVPQRKCVFLHAEQHIMLQLKMKNNLLDFALFLYE
jgi:hypothetical protein